MTSVTTIEDDGKELNNRQKEFARYYVEGIYSNAECARKAGYSPASARTAATYFCLRAVGRLKSGSSGLRCGAPMYRGRDWTEWTEWDRVRDTWFGHQAYRVGTIGSGSSTQRPASPGGGSLDPPAAGPGDKKKGLTPPPQIVLPFPPLSV